MRPFFFIEMIFLIHGSLFGQSDKMQTDRPDQSDGATTVLPKELQLETALILDVFKGESNAFVSATTIRYGLLKKLEARLLVEQGYHRDLHIEATAHGQYPVALSSKLTILEQHPVIPDLALMAYLQIPVTSQKLPKIWSPAFTLIAEKKICELTLTTNMGIRQAAFENSWAWQASADSKYEISKSVDIFFEYFAQYAAHEYPLHNVDGGVLFHLNKKLMLHLAGGTNIFYHDGGYYFFNTGFAVHI